MKSIGSHWIKIAGIDIDSNKAIVLYSVYSDPFTNKSAPKIMKFDLHNNNRFSYIVNRVADMQHKVDGNLVNEIYIAIPTYKHTFFFSKLHSRTKLEIVEIRYVI